MNFFKLYLLSLVIFFCIDLIWLGIIAKNLYRAEIGFLMADQIRWVPAFLFYLIYIAGLVFFALLPAENWMFAALYGAGFGLVCYATYDLTNLATLSGWPIRIVVYDLLWGTFISATTAATAFWIGHHAPFK